MYTLYSALTWLASPLMPLVLERRRRRGKEDAARLTERLGRASLPRPQGRLAWIHAASVGEANAALPLIEALLAEHKQLHVLLTTVTVTSAALMATRLPERALHQFAPVDTPQAVHAFLMHWQPDVALWVDSELWPNLIMQTVKRRALMGIINARMSERSYQRWRRLPSFISPLLAAFSLCFAQSQTDADRLRALGLTVSPTIGNLKYDVPPLPCDETELARLRGQAQDRAVWLAASTHPGEEARIAEVHRQLAGQGIRLLTVIVPRHVHRGEAIAAELAPLSVARRSKGEAITPETAIYLADTMGELGLFYRLASAVFIGGTLVPHGGQNPLEAARLGCAIIAGPHMENFAAIAAAMERDEALVRVADASGLGAQLEALLAQPEAARQLGRKAQAHVGAHAGALAEIMQQLRPYLT